MLLPALTLDRKKKEGFDQEDPVYPFLCNPLPATEWVRRPLK